jgi:Na+/phosphate symporter
MIGFLFFYGKDLGFLRKEVFWQLEDEIEAVRIEVDGYVDVFDEEINAYSASFFNTEMEEIETKINELWIEMDEV